MNTIKSIRFYFKCSRGSKDVNSMAYLNLIRKTYGEKKIDAKCLPVSNCRDFISVLSSIKEETTGQEGFPFIHFDSHANKNGLILDSGVAIPWKLVLWIISNISSISEQMPVISLATGKGKHLIKCYRKNKSSMPDHEDLPPFTFISSNVNCPVEIATARWIQFFSIFMKSTNMKSAMKALNTLEKGDSKLMLYKN